MDDPHQVAVEAAKSLSDACLGTLRSPAVSAILHGSLTAGDFLPGLSDIDLLLLVGHDMTDSEICALVSAVKTAELGGAAGIDLLVADAAVCRAPTPHPPLPLLVGRYPGGSPELEIVARADSFAGLLPELSMARETGCALYGTEPSDAIGPVPREWIEEQGRYWLSRWLGMTDDADNAAFMVLTACRMWRFTVNGVHCSKSAAARWALARNPSLTAIDQALHQRLEHPQQPIDEDGIKAVLNAAISDSGSPSA